MNNTILTLLFGITLLLPRLHAEVNKQATADTEVYKQITADVNTVAGVVAASERDNVVWFLIHGDSALSGEKRFAMMTAKNEINKIPDKGEAHDALVRLLGSLMSSEKAALDSRQFAYARLTGFAAKDASAKKALDDATKTVKERDADPLAAKLK